MDIIPFEVLNIAFLLCIVWLARASGAGGGGAQWYIAPLNSETIQIVKCYVFQVFWGKFLWRYLAFVLSMNFTYHFSNIPSSGLQFANLRENCLNLQTIFTGKDLFPE
jgi:hypothetical protein